MITILDHTLYGKVKMEEKVLTFSKLGRLPSPVRATLVIILNKMNYSSSSSAILDSELWRLHVWEDHYYKNFLEKIFYKGDFPLSTSDYREALCILTSMKIVLTEASFNPESTL